MEKRQFNMHVIALGQPYGSTPQQWPEGAQYACRNRHHELLISYSAPTEEEITQARSSQMRFAFHQTAHNIFFCYKFGDGPWSDTTFNWHRQQPEDKEEIPAPFSNPMERATISAIFINANDGTVVALRYLTFTPDFSNALHQAIQKQAATPFNEEAQLAEIEEIFKQFNSSQLATLIAQQRCIG